MPGNEDILVHEEGVISVFMDSLVGKTYNTQLKKKITVKLPIPVIEKLIECNDGD